jgi:hypothetical protein
MKKISKVSGLFLTISALASIVWIGSYMLRMFLTYQIFNETLTGYRSFVNEQNIQGILEVLNPAVITTFIAYIIFIVFFIFFLVTSKLSLKQNGWLFIITILILITAPFEIYLMVIDYKIFTQVNSGIFESNKIITLIVDRFKNLSTFPIIEVLSYFAIVFLAIFKPMKRKNTTNEN